MRSSGAVLPNVERMLISVARRRGVEARRRRRRGPRLTLIAFAGLALAGSALAATGVWNPLAGDHHRTQHPARSSGAARADIGSAGSAPDLPGGPRGERPPQGANGHDLGGTTVPRVAEPAIARGGEPDTGQGPASNGAGAHGPASVGGRSPAIPGASDVGGGRQVESPGPGGGTPEGPPGEAPPNEGPSGPRPTRVSVFCGPETETGAIHCRATVFAGAGSPTGQVFFADTGSGQFSASSCALGDDGNGTSSSCAVDYSPALPNHEAVASYGGDSANAPSSTSFVV